MRSLSRSSSGRLGATLRRVAPVVLALLAAAPLRAQGTIRGVLFDSLRTRAGIPGVEVVLLGAGRRATTDGRGRFEFLDVPAGAAEVAWGSPSLDSLGLPPLRARVNVANAAVVDVRLATPSIASFQRRACGTALGENEGILVGEVRGPDGAPQAGVAVGARWHETLIARGVLEGRQRAALDTVDATGLYVLCGIPTDAEVALVAGSETVASGQVVLGLHGAPVLRRDLVAGPWEVTARVTGRLVGADGAPVAGATVGIAGDTGRTARTAADGRFVLEGVPRRTTQFIARAIGLVPRFVERDLLEPEVDLDTLHLERVQELAAVTVTGEPMTAGQLQFEHRKSLGRGWFVSDTALARLPVITSSAVASFVPRAAVQQTRQGPMLMLRRGSAFCRPRWFIDGYDNRDIDVIEEQGLMQRAKRIEVYDANMAPPPFNDFDGCGVVVVWTR